MGVWGTGLYQSDDTADFKSEFSDSAKLPIDTDALVARMCKAYALGKDPHDEDEVDFWLALADQLHRYGLDHPATFATARDIIISGADLAVKTELEMSPADLKKRAKVLEDLLDAWSRPHPKPRKRRMMKGPQKLLLGPGEVWVMPAMQGAPLPFFWHRYDPDTIDTLYKPDGWAGFVVSEAWHYDTFFAHYTIAVLNLVGSEKPTLDQIPGTCLRTMIDKEYYIDKADDELKHRPALSDMIFTTQIGTPSKTLRLWKAECIGTLETFDAQALRDAMTSPIKDNLLADRGVASMEHLMTLSSFHHTHNNPFEDVADFSFDPEKPMSRFL
ncbi:MAG: hypothetical protein AAGB10_19805 [Pseudomonadota bacterium]